MKGIFFVFAFLSTFLFQAAPAICASIEIRRDPAQHGISQVFVDGAIEPGDAKALDGIIRELNKNLRFNDDYHTVYLNCPGGDYGEAVALGRVIAKEHAATAVAGGARCDGACVISFLGGRVWDGNNFSRLKPSRSVGRGVALTSPPIKTDMPTRIALYEYATQLNLDPEAVNLLYNKDRPILDIARVSYMVDMLDITTPYPVSRFTLDQAKNLVMNLSLKKSSWRLSDWEFDLTASFMSRTEYMAAMVEKAFQAPEKPLAKDPGFTQLPKTPEEIAGIYGKLVKAGAFPEMLQKKKAVIAEVSGEWSVHHYANKDVYFFVYNDGEPTQEIEYLVCGPVDLGLNCEKKQVKSGVAAWATLGPVDVDGEIFLPQ